MVRLTALRVRRLDQGSVRGRPDIPGRIDDSGQRSADAAFVETELALTQRLFERRRDGQQEADLRQHSCQPDQA